MNLFTHHILVKDLVAKHIFLDSIHPLIEVKRAHPDLPLCKHIAKFIRRTTHLDLNRKKSNSWK